MSQFEILRRFIGTWTIHNRGPVRVRLSKERMGTSTFHVFPDGIAREAGEYLDEDTAREASLKVLLIWEANGYAYGPLGTIIKQTFLVG